MNVQSTETRFPAFLSCPNELDLNPYVGESKEEEYIELFHRIIKAAAPADQLLLAHMIEHHYEFVGEVINVAFERFDHEEKAKA